MALYQQRIQRFKNGDIPVFQTNSTGENYR